VLLENHDWFIYNVEIDNQDQTGILKIQSRLVVFLLLFLILPIFLGSPLSSNETTGAGGVIY
jgi:hypothetical protein